MVANLSPVACPLPPDGERCPDCGQPAVLRHKGRRPVRCAACSLAALRARKRAYHVAHRAERQERRRNGGVPWPPYVAWTVEWWNHRTAENAGANVYDSTGLPVAMRQAFAPAAVVLPAYGACSCGEAGCVHLVVACLAQQAGGGEQDG